MASGQSAATEPVSSRDHRPMSSAPVSASGRRADSRSKSSSVQETPTSTHGEAEPTDNDGNPETHITTPSTAATPAVEVKADEDDEICAICYKGDFTDDNLIVFCEGKCRLGFHQKCYGIENIPPGDEPWLCDWCAVGNITTYSKNLYCCHYKNDKTARTLIINDGRTEPSFVHVHVQCAAWIPTVDTGHIPFTTDVPKLKSARSKCYFCNSPYRFQVKCEHMDGDTPCENSFHPMCAMRYKFLEPPTQYDVKYANHVCPKHTQEKLDKVSKRRRASDAGASLPSKRVTRRQSALPFSSSRGTSNSLLDSHSPSPSTPDDRQGQPDRRATRLPESMDDEVSGSDTSPRQDDSNPPSSGGQEGSKRRIGRRKRRPRRGSAAPGRQEYYNRTIVKVHSGLSRLKEGQTLGDDDENDFGSSINLGSHASDQEDEVIGRGSIAGQDEHVPETGLRSHSRSASTSAAATDKTSPSASNGSRKDKRRLTLRVGSKDAERNSGNSSDETIDEPIVSGLRGKNADHSKTNSESAGQNAQRSSPLPTQSPRQQSRILPAVLEDRASASQSNKSRILPAVTEGRGSTSQNHQLARKRPDPLVSQRNKRSVVHVRAYDRPPNTPPLGSGAGGYSLSAGPRANPSLYALERSERIAAASVTMPEEQVAMIKETHEMMKAQNDMLKSVQDMIKEIVDSPSRQAQQALSTISNLSALVSNGVNGDSVAAYDSTSASALNAGPSAAKDSNGTNNGIGISGTNGVLALPKCTSDSISSGSTAPSAPKPFSGAVELQLPKSAAASPKLPTTNSLASVRPPLGPSILSGITQATGQSPAHAPAASRSLGSDPRLDGDELEEMKENIIYLIKAVNIPQVLNGMISSSGDHTLPSGSGGSRPVSPTSSTSDSKTLPPQLKTMLADLRRFGALSKDNVHEYLKVLVSSMKDVRSKHV